MPELRFRERVLAVVSATPEGRVTTYGLIARHLGISPRQVAAVLASFTPRESVLWPWYRVVGAGGLISTMKLGRTGRRQIARLQAEGVTVTPRNHVADFEMVVWEPAW